ncbi:omptin family outer membrane protease [Sinorhizobium sp. RAC02]|uniref:omptin family outer membrane protease n=1 Tax=Sinorhizobium sp. RAC02 TaxID=1842534 RepID=UPI000AD487D5|nr:omptin family outer membrane protease [Sinorhizobium sp. RAC02]
MLRSALAALALGTPMAHAGDMTARSADGSLWLSGGVGLMNIEAHEYVYLGNDKASQLDWDTDGVTLYTVAAGADLGSDWHVKGKFDFGFGGDGHMVDYDWVPGFAIDQSMDGWSDRSIHPDTRLDYYFSSTFEIGKNVFADERSTVSVGGGVKYTQVRWDAFGGSYIYSEGGIRNDIGEIPDGLRGITYQQNIPTLFVGFDGSTSFDRLTLSGGVKGGMTVGIDDTDDHWLTATRSFGDMNAAPVLMLNAAVDYQLTETASIYLAGNFENVFHRKGDLNSTDTSTGAATLYRNAAGASFKTMSLQFGVRGRF